MEHVEIAVIGAGPGGYHCAQLLGAAGKKVILFEAEHVGGTCLNEGCMPTKALLNCAKRYRYAKDSKVFGVTAENVSYNHKKAVAKKNGVVRRLVAGVENALKESGVMVIRESASLNGRTDNGFAVKTPGGAEYEAEKVVLAAGSETVIPPIPGLKEGLASGFVVTNREFLSLTELPEHFAVIGGGVVGLEMACFLASVGVKVTVVEMMPKIAGQTDEEACALLQSSYEKRGMRFLLGTQVKRVEEDGLYIEKDGSGEKIFCDRVLLSAGRRAHTAGLGLESLNIATERGAVVTDAKLCTNVPGIYAVGDVNGRLMLAHTAYREAEVVANNLLGKEDEMDYSLIPSVIYTDPEVASVGESKESAEKKGIAFREICLPMAYSGRFMAESESGQGFIKLVTEEGTGCVLGVTLVGLYASEMILSAEMMIGSRLPAEALRKLIFPHPTVGEVMKEALFRIEE